MPRRAQPSVENHFIAGLKSDFTGLNFPENAAVSTDNAVYQVNGEVNRRLGIDTETNGVGVSVSSISPAGLVTYKWRNADGAGLTDLLVVQFGTFLHFYRYSEATVAAPTSAQHLVNMIDTRSFQVGTTSTSGYECQFAEGNGHLFVFNPAAKPFYCTYDSATTIVSALGIDVKIRDTIGINEPGIEDNDRPLTLTGGHHYNLINQGWTPNFTVTSTTSVTVGTGSKSFAVPVGLPIIPGMQVRIYQNVTQGIGTTFMSGPVLAYIGTSVTVNVAATAGAGTFATWIITPEPPTIGIWTAATANFPSNSDVWWYFKNSSNVFAPATTINNVTASAGPAPKGAVILDAWLQDRTAASGIIVGLPPITSTGDVRPSTGTWFQGRVWYAGVNYQGFSEKIYFSQIVEREAQFARCYQTNDPTSEQRFDLLPADGGVISIQGVGTIYKLFPIQNGMFVFSTKGVWFITGSSGLGFTATDYVVIKLSDIASISSSSFVNVNGLPMWWNDTGIYTIQPDGNSFKVTSLTYGNIGDLYSTIPLSAKLQARGDYNPLDFTIQWIYWDGIRNETGFGLYKFNSILVFNTATQAFYTWTVPTSSLYKLLAVNYIPSANKTTPVAPTFEYLTLYNGSDLYFAKEWKTNYLDWGVESPATFTVGYKVHGDAQRKIQPTYLYLFSAGPRSAYKVQGIFNYGNNPNSGRWSTVELTDLNDSDFDDLYRRHKIRGSGVAYQFKVTSRPGLPFQLVGWSIYETQNAGI